MPGLVGPGNGDGEAEGLELADVVAELAVGVGAGLVVAGAQVGELICPELSGQRICG